jgi:hypothetical protein
MELDHRLPSIQPQYLERIRTSFEQPLAKFYTTSIIPEEIFKLL